MISVDFLGFCEFESIRILWGSFTLNEMLSFFRSIWSECIFTRQKYMHIKDESMYGILFSL